MVTVNATLRARLRHKQGGHCCYCEVTLIPAEAPTKARKPHPASETLEHLKRTIDGGTNRPDNLALACYECNVGRGSIDWLTYTTYRRGQLWDAA